MSIPKRRPSRTPDSASQYFDRSPSVASERRPVQLDAPGRTLHLDTDAGVFAHGRLDSGTRVLLGSVPPPPAAGELLDLGAGYGPIALWLAAQAPGAQVWALDVNERALELARDNAAAAGLSNVVAASPEDVPSDLRFAAIYSNPPIRIGKEPLHDLLLRWMARLEPAGRAYLVVQHHLGSDSLARWLQEQGWAVSRMTSKQGYRVLEVSAKE